MNNKYPKGSEWRKWDLHIHSPSSFFWKGSKKLKDMNSDEIKSEMINFIKSINESEIEVFCLMDYWNFDWYLELQNFVTNNLGVLKKTVFPGMEFRIQCPVDYRLNIHCILSDKLTKQQLLDFKSELYISSIDKKLSDESIENFAKTLDESKARKHGYDNPNILSSEKLFELGSKTIEITQESLKKAFDQIPTKMGFVILPYDTSDGLLNLDWEKHPHADNYFMQSTHIFESRDIRNIELITGIRNTKNTKIFDNFFKTLGNKSKPCIAGSDAHRYSDYGKFPSNKITWIKGNPTFEGLKQIIFEPKDRVKIQEAKPEVKLESNVINRVRFIPQSGCNDFSDEWIEINDNLNTIIGGKSSGKSLLLSMISKTIDNTININQYERIITESLTDFEVEWKDGAVFKYSEKEFYFDDQQEKYQKRRPISHIPQLAIHKLIEEKPEEYKSIILNFLKEDETFKNYYDNFEKGIDDTIEKINTGLIQLFKNQSILDRDKEELKHLGDFKAKKSEASQLTKKLKSMGLENLTEEERSKYIILKDAIESSNIELTNKKELIEAVNDYQKEVDNSLNKFEEDIKNSCDDIANFLIEANQTEILKIKDELLKIKNGFATQIKKVFEPYSSLLKETEKLTETLETENQKLNVFIQKTGDESQIKELKDKLSELTEEVKEIEKFELKAKVHLERITEAKDKILEGYETLLEKYKDLKREINLNYDDLIPQDGISLNLEIEFNQEAFNRDFVELFDRRFSIGNVSSHFTNNSYAFNISSQKAMVKEFLDKLIRKDETINFKKKFEYEKAIRAIVGNYFVPNFKLSQGGEEVESMSYGKRSLVLLKLYLALNKNENPILIDQPEDNLDNRTIYSELKEFIREKKKQRQIIVVTHNANLVVSTDAECIIVASQEGINEKINKNHRFEYTSGALENTFQSDLESGILNSMGIQEHVCDVLEGGKRAFEERELKYGFK